MIIRWGPLVRYGFDRRRAPDSNSMHSLKWRLIALAITIVLPLAGTSAQNTTHVSLEDAIVMALAHNHALQGDPHPDPSK